MFQLNGTKDGKPYVFDCYLKLIINPNSNLFGETWIHIDNASTGYESALLADLLNTDKITWRACAGSNNYNECIVDISNLKEVLKGKIGEYYVG